MIFRFYRALFFYLIVALIAGNAFAKDDELVTILYATCLHNAIATGDYETDNGPRLFAACNSEAHDWIRYACEGSLPYCKAAAFVVARQARDAEIIAAQQR